MRKMLFALSALGVIALGGSAVACSDVYRINNYGALRNYETLYDGHSHVVGANSNNCVVTNSLKAKKQCGHHSWDAAAQNSDSDLLREAKYELLKIYFAFDSAELSAASKIRLDDLVTFLQSSYNVKTMDLVGYTDNLGGENYNYELAHRRAESVRNYILSKGYSKVGDILVKPLGERVAQADCAGIASTEEAKNCLWRERRVEVELHFGE